MAKRRKTVYAGRLVYDVIYTVPTPRDPEEVRKEIKKISAEAIARTNCNCATRKLELLLAANFELYDLVFTVTYRDDDLPADYKEAQKRLGQYIRDIRKQRKLRGAELKYVYVPEGRHGDHRIHHHIVINATGTSDLEELRSLWRWGDEVDLKYIKDKGYDGWARYLSKERREASLNGKRMYTPSRNLVKPEVDYQWCDDATTIEAPIGATVIDESQDRNQFASYRFIKYVLPEPRRAEKKLNKVAFYSGLKHPLTYRTGCRKRGKTVDRRL